MVLSDALPSILPKRHGAHVDAARADRAADLGMHESHVAALRLRARNDTAPRTVVVQELPWDMTADNIDGSSASNVPINEEGAVLSERPELRQNVLATRYHLRWVVSRDVRRERNCKLSPRVSGDTHGPLEACNWRSCGNQRNVEGSLREQTK